MNPDAVSWCIWKRRVDAEALHQKDPQRIASIHPLLQDIDHIAFDKTGAQERPTAQEIEDELAAVGPGAIASVFDEIAQLRQSGADFSICVRVVQRVGGAQMRPF